MRSLLLLAGLLALALPSAAAQTDAPGDTDTSVESLAIPESPGFILLDAAPEVVERPSSVTDFAASVLSHGREGGIPDRYAVQVAPFWMANTFTDLPYGAYAAGASGYDAFRRTLSLSAATSLEGVEGEPSSTTLALGARFAVVTGRIDTSNANYGRTLRQIRGLLRMRSAGLAAYIEQAIEQDARIIALQDSQRERARAGAGDAELDSLSTLIAARIAVVREQAPQAFTTALVESRQQLRELAASLRERRVGPSLEFAGAVAFGFPARDFDDARVSRWGAWATGGYTGAHFTALAVARYLNGDALTDTTSTSFDVGGRLIYDHPAGRFSFSGEGVYRAGLTDGADHSYRADVSLSYVVARGRKLSFTFGRDFDGVQTEGGNVLALLNLILGFGTDRPGPAAPSPAPGP